MKLPWSFRLPWRRAAIERAAWLADDTLLTIGWCLGPAENLEATLSAGGTTRPVEAHWIAYPRPDLDAPAGAGRVAIVRFSSALDPHRAGTLTLGAGGATWSITTHALQNLTAPVEEVVALGVGWLDANTRANVLAFLCGSMGLAGPSANRIGAHLAAIRDVLRTPLPEEATIESPGCAARLERVLRIDERSFYLKGWAYLPASTATQLTAVSPEGHRVEFLGRAFRFHREDLAGWTAGNLGFVAYVQLPTPSVVREGWIVELAALDGSSGQSVECPVLSATTPVLRELLLADFDLDQERTGRLIQEHISPAIVRLQEMAGAAPAVREVVRYGAAVEAPAVSIVVPLYKRIDLLEHQLAAFALDPGMREVELIYVLDSPDLAAATRDIAWQLHELYRLPFQIVFLERHLGFAGANNAAAPLAKGRLLLLLNSDVFPSGAGWVERMRAFYESTPQIGALGVKLLYEDNTLQHAGLYFRRDAPSGVWENQHYFKGLEQTFAPANQARRVPAVTGACLMISRSLYLAQGGLRGMYLQGDYEDSDLCLRLLTSGHDNWYLPDVELYHLEGQSYGWTKRAPVSRYNAWTHTHLWNDVIEDTMTRFNP